MTIRRLKYYEDEDARIPDIVKMKCTKAEAHALVAELCDAFELKPIQLFLSLKIVGNSYYITNADEKLRYILLSELNVGTIIHEVAHYWDHMRAYMPIKPAPSKLIRTLERKKPRYHCKRHADLVDILAEYIRSR